MLYMTIIVIGRPPVPTNTDAAVVFVTLAIMVSASVIPAFVAELARLYFESQGQETYKGDPKIAHIILCGDITIARLKAFLGQFFHKSRDAEILAPVVVLADHKYEGPLRALIEQSRYAGSVAYIRGSARRPADVRRAGGVHASTAIILCTRIGVEAADADSEVGGGQVDTGPAIHRQFHDDDTSRIPIPVPVPVLRPCRSWRRALPSKPSIGACASWHRCAALAQWISSWCCLVGGTMTARWRWLRCP